MLRRPLKAHPEELLPKSILRDRPTVELPPLRDHFKVLLQQQATLSYETVKKINYKLKNQ